MKNSRREFVKVSLAASGGLCFAVTLPGGTTSRALASIEEIASGSYTSLYFEVTPENEFLFSFDKAEMGQGVITGQATMFGEEADIDPMKLVMRPAMADSRYGTQGGHMITGGSTSTADRFDLLRRVGATYRDHVLSAAAKDWQVSKDKLQTENGHVVHPINGKKIPYAAFNKTMSKIEAPDIETIALKPKGDWKYIGKKSASIDALDKSTGVPEFGIDFELPNMKTAIVLRSPVFGGRLKSFDKKAILSIDGVSDVKEVYSGVALICDSYWRCLAAKPQVTDQMIQWDISLEDKVTSENLFQEFRASLDQTAPKAGEGQKVVSAEYQLPYLSHSPMEPQNGVAWKQEDKFEFWVPTQGPTLIQNYAAMKSGMKRDDVKVHNAKYLGGGFGRRGQMDYPMELIDIAVQVDYPVKLMWSREDDVKFSPMRPMSTHRFDAVVDNKVGSWRHQMAGQSILQDLIKTVMPLMMPEWMPESVGSGVGNLTAGALDTFGKLPMMTEGSKQPYALPIETEIVEHELKIPVTYWRSVGHSHNGFVVESFLDEVVHSMGKDPLQVRLDLLKDAPRARKVVELVANKSGYRNFKAKEGRALGLAYHFSFNTHCAEVAEVEVKANQIIVHKVTAVVDVGTAVNPDIVKKQVQSGIIFGLSAALQGSIDFKDGEVVQSNFHDYPLMRLNETPDIEVHIVDSDEPPSGIGEPGLPPLAAAVGNAIFKITGKRLRRLPLTLS